MKTTTTSSGRVPRLLSLFRRELELCNVRPGENIAIYTEGGEAAEYAEAWATAAVALGATPFHLDLPAQAPSTGSDIGGSPDGHGLAKNPAAVAALKAADMVIDLAFLLHSAEQEEITAAGTRMLLCVEPVDTLERLFPTVALRDEAKASYEMLKNAKTMRMSSAGGTEISYEFGDYTASCQYGIADEPGRWDHFASALVGHLPSRGKAEGVVVLQPGDMLFPFRRYVNDPVTMTVKDGFITSFEGGSDARFLRDFYESYADPGAYQVSHVNWGLNPNARWDAIALGTGGIGMDCRSIRGGVLFSTGPNLHHGGDNATKCHVDIPMRNHSLWVDDRLIVDNGRVVHDALAQA